VNRLGGISARRALTGLAVLIVVGGFALALLSNANLLLPGSSSLPGLAANEQELPLSQVVGNVSFAQGSSRIFFGASGLPGYSSGVTEVIGTATTMSTTTIGYPAGTATPAQTGTNLTQGTPGGAGGLIEFSSDLGLRAASPEQTASAVAALAYSVGGYVAYQSTYSASAYVVVRVPAAQYQQVLTKIEAMGTVLSLTSNSNDVHVQYTDLNATVASLQTEQGALLRLLNQSASINSTLAIESQLQQVNQQINDIESQILQTRTLISYATVNVTVSETVQSAALSMVLSATPRNGTAPLSVTFNAIVKGGAQPYVVNYNFGDGYASEGQIVIHTYFQAGDYKIVVTATDQNGTVTQATTTVNVQAPQAQSGLSAFMGNVGGLFISVVEGIVEVAVVVIPIAAVGAAIIIPVQRRGRGQKGIKQSQ